LGKTDGIGGGGAGEGEWGDVLSAVGESVLNQEKRKCP